MIILTMIATATAGRCIRKRKGEGVRRKRQ